MPIWLWKIEGSVPAPGAGKALVQHPWALLAPPVLGVLLGAVGEPLAGVVEVAQQPHLQSVLHLGLSLG